MAFADLVAGVDRAAFSALGGVPVTYDPAGAGPPVSTTPSGDPLLGMFDEQYVLARGVAEAGVEMIGPAVFLIKADLPTDPEVDADPTVTIAGVGYRVRERIPDGMGGIVLALHKIV